MKHKTINGWTKELMKAQIRLNMRAKSVNGNGICQYRSTYNNKPTACAVGCFIPDSKYVPELENSIAGGFRFQTLTNTVRFPLEYSGLREMQIVHDESFKDNPAEEVCGWIDENVEDVE